MSTMPFSGISGIHLKNSKTSNPTGLNQALPNPFLLLNVLIHSEVCVIVGLWMLFLDSDWKLRVHNSVEAHKSEFSFAGLRHNYVKIIN